MDDRSCSSKLNVYQANVFYNYSIGFECTDIDLMKTSAKLLKSGVAESIFFSDFKCVYLDESGKTQVELLRPEGRSWDSNWKIKFSENLPLDIAENFAHSCEHAFHEHRLVHDKTPYIRANLPPIVLTAEEFELPLLASVKIYKDGIAILSFHLDANWNGLGEEHFISDVVNLSQYYFQTIWVDSEMQKRDGKVVLESAFEDVLSIGGTSIDNFKSKFLIRKMKKTSQTALDDSLSKSGCAFDFGGDKEWYLHEIACTESDENWESTIETCRSIYTNNLRDLIASVDRSSSKYSINAMWQGRPSITLLRYEGQPNSKDELLNKFSNSMSKILLRTGGITSTPELPYDLRLFDDYCLHGNRSTILWTWLSTDGQPDNAWDDELTYAKVIECQVKAEMVEHINMILARACSWAEEPTNEEYLVHAYQTLSRSESMIHKASQSGEITNMLSHLIKSFGTLTPIEASKDSARFYLEELKYKADKEKQKSDSLLTFVFGLVGTTSLAQFAFTPYVDQKWPNLSAIESPAVSLAMSTGLIVIIALLIWSCRKFRNYFTDL